MRLFLQTLPYRSCSISTCHQTGRDGGGGTSSSKFHYELQNKEGQKLTGKYGLEEHLWKDQEATQHQTVEHNSEGVFAPQNSQGEYTDNVGYGSFQKGLAVGSFDVYQTFSVSYKGAAVNLSTEFEHETGVMGLDIFNHVAVIKP